MDDYTVYNYPECYKCTKSNIFCSGCSYNPWYQGTTTTTSPIFINTEYVTISDSSEETKRKKRVRKYNKMFDKQFVIKEMKVN